MNQKIPIKKARLYWNEKTDAVLVANEKHPAKSDSVKYPNWICVGGDAKAYSKINAIADLFGELLWLWEQDRINLKGALIEIRKIEGVTEWLDERGIWI
jgi:hypothetical protein